MRMGVDLMVAISPITLTENAGLQLRGTADRDCLSNGGSEVALFR